MPKNLRSSSILVGDFMLSIASILFLSGLIPSFVISWPIYSIFFYFSNILSLFILRFCSLHLCNNFYSFASWSISASWSVVPLPYTKISTATTAIPSIPSKHSTILLWYSSGAEEIPNGNLSHLYLPKGVLNVVKSLDALSNSTYQKPFLASSKENIRAFVSFGNISSIVGN